MLMLIKTKMYFSIFIKNCVEKKVSTGQSATAR